MYSFVPTGWYTATLSVAVLVVVVAALTGRDHRLRWPAAAMLLSLVAARTATAWPDFTLPILLATTPVTAVLAALGRTRESYVVAAAYLPRLSFYALFALGVLPLWAMWEASNLFLIVQIGALGAGSFGGGHWVRNMVGLGGSRRRRVAGAVAPAAVLGHHDEGDTRVRRLSGDEAGSTASEEEVAR